MLVWCNPGSAQYIPRMIATMQRSAALAAIMLPHATDPTLASPIIP